MTSHKAFFGGCLLGGVLGIVLLFGGAYAGVVLFRDKFVANMSKDLKAPKITTGTPADYSLKVKKPDGSLFDMESVKGKAVFLNFWSPLCSHCESELTSLQKLYEQCYGFGVEFMCVAVDNPDQVPGLIQKYSLTLPIYVLDGTRPAVYDSDSAPLTFLLTPNGEIALRIRGSAKWDDISVAATLKLLSTIEKDDAAKP